MADGNRTLPLYDIHTAAFLEYRGIELTLTKQGTRVVFEVPTTDEAYRALAEYQTNPDIPLLDFVAVLRRLRGRMLDERDGERRYGYGNHRP